MNLAKRSKVGLASMGAVLSGALLFGAAHEGDIVEECLDCLASGGGLLVKGSAEQKEVANFAVAEPTSAGSEEAVGRVQVGPPLVCTLGEGDRIERAKQAQRELFQNALSTKELADGYEISFPDTKALAEKTLAFVMLERECCSFIRFEMSFEAGGGPLKLRLTGRSGVKEILKAWIPAPEIADQK